MKKMTLLCLLFSVFGGWVTFWSKQQVLALEKSVATLQRNILVFQEDIHLAKAEWSYLTRPEAIEHLASTLLAMKPLGPHQVQTYQDIACPSSKSGTQEVT